jgi:hypothetical protein
MLHGYEQQLLAARRLARFKVRRCVAAGIDPRDPDPDVKRRQFVEKVARELYETLMFTGSDNPVVEEIRRELSESFGQEVDFTYPPGGTLCLVVRTPEGARPLTEEEQGRMRPILWRLTREKVDGSMLNRIMHRQRGCTV